VGLLTPVGAGEVIGVMAVAGVMEHRTNGFFIFKPGQGWEYVMVLVTAALALAGTGSGGWSLDAALG
jgi:putative oxidoreductase